MNEVVDSFKASMIRALEQERFDDVVFLLANRLRSRQQVVSVHARSALPVNREVCQPLRSARLTQDQIATFGFQKEGWYIIAVEDCAIVAADPFPYTVEDPDYRARIQDHVRAVSATYTELPDIFATYHLDGLLLEFQHLYEFRPECRRA
ncbi:hypothetical protein [Roseovarius dicentrarchi]|uniref:hypothetical protein n=1 Tax=Roseovarius dicentrarchi TaxID=2250573 RepID=UPI00139668C1|nr:hypothetical protein [Roseovarius dicentrarchi]